VERRSIFLVGFMGSGKTRVGQELARRLALPFEDTDARIEKAVGRSIERLFADEGEAEFRALESRELARLVQEADTPRVIATGGGLFVAAENRERIQRSGISLWLDVSDDEVLRRLGEKSGRPLATSPAELAALHRQRRPAYAAAHARVDGAGDSVEAVVDRALAALEDLGWGSNRG
jgi:shikimate kinase